MLLRELDPTFTLEDARAAGLSKDQVYSMLARDEIERVGRGVFARVGAVDPSFVALAAATATKEEATLCLTSALVHHDLSDAIPFDSDIALPRGMHRPSGIANVRWHSFDPATFQIGREAAGDEGGTSVAIYSAERSIVDSFRLMHQEGSDIAYEALRRCLRRKGSTPASLLKVAGSFPKALPRLRHALEVLL